MRATLAPPSSFSLPERNVYIYVDYRASTRLHRPSKSDREFRSRLSQASILSSPSLRSETRAIRARFVIVRLSLSSLRGRGIGINLSLLPRFVRPCDSIRPFPLRLDRVAATFLPPTHFCLGYGYYTNICRSVFQTASFLPRRKYKS